MPRLDINVLSSGARPSDPFRVSFAQLLGGYIGVTGDGRAVPNFYELYSRRRSKPMVVPETAAWFNSAAKDGADRKLELSLKSAWFRQVRCGAEDTAQVAVRAGYCAQATRVISKPRRDIRTQKGLASGWYMVETLTSSRHTYMCNHTAANGWNTGYMPQVLQCCANQMLSLPSTCGLATRAFCPSASRWQCAEVVALLNHNRVAGVAYMLLVHKAGCCTTLGMH
jgi:hypothetical protein